MKKIKEEEICEKLKPQIQKLETWGRIGRVCMQKEVEIADFLPCLIEQAKVLLAEK